MIVNDETVRTEPDSWAESHPWLALEREEDTVEEEILYALDELRFC